MNLTDWVDLIDSETLDNFVNQGAGGKLASRVQDCKSIKHEPE